MLINATPQTCMQDWQTIATHVDDILREFHSIAEENFGMPVKFFRITDGLNATNKPDWDCVQARNALQVSRLTDAFKAKLLQDKTYQRIKEMRDSQLEYTLSEKEFIADTSRLLNLYVREILNNRKLITRYDAELIANITECSKQTIKLTQNHITRTEELVRCVLLNDDLFRLIRGYHHLVLEDPTSTFAYLNALRAAKATNTSIRPDPKIILLHAIEKLANMIDSLTGI